MAPRGRSRPGDLHHRHQGQVHHRRGGRAPPGRPRAPGHGGRQHRPPALGPGGRRPVRPLGGGGLELPGHRSGLGPPGRGRHLAQPRPSRLARRDRGLLPRQAVAVHPAGIPADRGRRRQPAAARPPRTARSPGPLGRERGPGSRGPLGRGPRALGSAQPAQRPHRPGGARGTRGRRGGRPRGPGGGGGRLRRPREPAPADRHRGRGHLRRRQPVDQRAPHHGRAGGLRGPAGGPLGGRARPGDRLHPAGRDPAAPRRPDPRAHPARQRAADPPRPRRDGGRGPRSRRRRRGRPGRGHPGRVGVGPPRRRGPVIAGGTELRPLHRLRRALGRLRPGHGPLRRRRRPRAGGRSRPARGAA